MCCVLLQADKLLLKVITRKISKSASCVYPSQQRDVLNLPNASFDQIDIKGECAQIDSPSGTNSAGVHLPPLISHDVESTDL